MAREWRFLKPRSDLDRGRYSSKRSWRSKLAGRNICVPPRISDRLYRMSPAILEIRKRWDSCMSLKE